MNVQGTLAEIVFIQEEITNLDQQIRNLQLHRMKLSEELSLLRRKDDEQYKEACNTLDILASRRRYATPVWLLVVNELAASGQTRSV